MALNIDKLIADNPLVDAEKFQRAQRAMKALAEQGIYPVRYQLSIPYECPVRRERSTVSAVGGSRARRRRSR